MKIMSILLYEFPVQCPDPPTKKSTQTNWLKEGIIATIVLHSACIVIGYVSCTSCIKIIIPGH